MKSGLKFINRCFLNQQHSKGEHVRQINIHKESTR